MGGWSAIKSHRDTPLPPTSQVARATFGLGVAYAAGLAVLERALPIKPAWVALEVVGGVLLVGLPVMITARSTPPGNESLNWHTYEQMVVAGFIGAGTPILVWQTIEYLLLPRL